MSLFDEKSPWIMNLLIQDFSLDTDGAAAILGNLGTESGGFKYYQELDPTSGRGGAGWAQWTGPRRVAFETYCQRNNLNPKSDKANYGYLFVELKGSEKKAIPAVKNANGLSEKVAAFEANFERAGVVNLASRTNYARQALAAWNANPTAKAPWLVDAPVEPPKPDLAALNAALTKENDRLRGALTTVGQKLITVGQMLIDAAKHQP